jgi:pimeloyl-ACP methyl ester carboxylesterase
MSQAWPERNHRIASWIVKKIFASALILSIFSPSLAKDTKPEIPFINIAPCEFLNKNSDYFVECGTLYTHENPDESARKQVSRTTRIVSIPFVVFHPSGDEVDVPLVITGGGGPGSPLYIEDSEYSEGSIYYDGLEASTLQSGRKLILMEMRGTGGSLPNLDCPDGTSFELDTLTTYPFKRDVELSNSIQALCVKNKRLFGIDPNLYNIDTAVEDIDVLRSLLGIEDWHLLGISHGTRVAMHYALKFPKRTASLVLDGLYPFEEDGFKSISIDLKKAFTQAFELCDSDINCKLSNGEPSISLLNRLLKQLEEQPEALSVPSFNLFWGEVVQDIKLSPQLLLYALYISSYDGDKVMSFPSTIKASLDGDFQGIIDLVSELLFNEAFSLFAEGAYISYSCYEEVPFSDIQGAIANARLVATDYWNDEPMLNEVMGLCDIWGIKPAPKSFKRFPHEKLTMPILILSGRLDQFTKTEWSARFVEKLPFKGKTQHLRIWELKSHNLVYADPCVDSVIRSFFDSPEGTMSNTCQSGD